MYSIAIFTQIHLTMKKMHIHSEQTTSPLNDGELYYAALILVWYNKSNAMQNCLFRAFKYKGTL